MSKLFQPKRRTLITLLGISVIENVVILSYNWCKLLTFTTKKKKKKKKEEEQFEIH